MILKKIVARTLRVILISGVVLLFCTSVASAQSEEPLSIEQQMAFDDLEMLLTDLIDKSEETPSAIGGIGQIITALNEVDGKVITTINILTERIKTEENQSHENFMTLMGIVLELQKGAHDNHMKLMDYLGGLQDAVLKLQDQDKFLLKRIEALEAKGVK